jgi:hypothetical protein
MRVATDIVTTQNSTPTAQLMMWQPVELEEIRVRSVGANQFDYPIPQSGTRSPIEP